MGSIRPGLIAAGTALALLTQSHAVSTLATAEDRSPPPVDVANAVVVNEVAPSGHFGQPTDEYVELRNTSDQSVALDGWQLRACISPGVAPLVRVFGSSEALGPGEYLWLAHVQHEPAVDSPPLDGHYSVDVPDDGGWLLSNPFTDQFDGVGLRSGLACTEGSAASPCDWTFGDAVTRSEDGADTDDNSADFTCRARTPGW